VLARRALRRLLAAHADAEVVGEAESLAEVIRRVAEQRPDLVLLDIELGDGDGFGLFGAVAEAPRVIFVTAHAEHAVAAFDVAAVDYLLKPVTQERFDAALARVRAARVSREVEGLIELRTPGRIVRTRPDGIVAVRAEGDFSRVHLVGQPPLMILRSIGQFEAMLPDPPFLRLGRSIMVNADHVRGIETRSRDETWLMLAGMGEPVILGRAAAMRLRAGMAGRAR